MLARRALGGDQRLVVAGSGQRRLRRHERERAGEVRARREQVLRSSADAAGIAAVAPLDRIAIRLLRLEVVEARRGCMALTDRERDRIRADTQIEIRRRADLARRRRDLDDVTPLDT